MKRKAELVLSVRIAEDENSSCLQEEKRGTRVVGKSRRAELELSTRREERNW